MPQRCLGAVTEVAAGVVVEARAVVQLSAERAGSSMAGPSLQMMSPLERLFGARADGGGTRRGEIYRWGQSAGARRRRR